MYIRHNGCCCCRHWDILLLGTATLALASAKLEWLLLHWRRCSTGTVSTKKRRQDRRVRLGSRAGGRRRNVHRGHRPEGQLPPVPSRRRRPRQRRTRNLPPRQHHRHRWLLLGMLLGGSRCCRSRRLLHIASGAAGGSVRRGWRRGGAHGRWMSARGCGRQLGFFQSRCRKNSASLPQ